MASFVGQRLSQIYTYLLQAPGGIGATPVNIEDGAGNQSAAMISSYGLNLPVDVSDVSNPPLDSELDTALGAPATVGDGFVAVVDDNDAETSCYLVWTDGTSWFHALGTKAA